MDSIFSSDEFVPMKPQIKDLRERVRTHLRQVEIPLVSLGDSPASEGEVAKRKENVYAKIIHKSPKDGEETNKVKKEEENKNLPLHGPEALTLMSHSPACIRTMCDQQQIQCCLPLPQCCVKGSSFYPSQFPSAKSQAVVQAPCEMQIVECPTSCPVQVSQVKCQAPCQSQTMQVKCQAPCQSKTTQKLMWNAQSRPLYPVQLLSLSRLTWLVPQFPRLREDSQPRASIRAPMADTSCSVSPRLPTATAPHSSNPGLTTTTAPPSVSPGLHLELAHPSARPEALMGASPPSVAPRAPADASLLASCNLLTAAVPLHDGLSPTTAAGCHQHVLRVPITTAPHHAALSPSIAVAVLGVPLQAALRDVVPSAG
ncbi:hypothetical protein GH733_018572 [Mirounga leonina]|nr:hypothetical protein GH733_018572 [Mirounga leonina]